MCIIIFLFFIKFKNSSTISEKVFLSGYTCKPPRKDLNKTALGAEFSVDWEPHRNTLLVTYKDDETGDQILRRIETRLINIVNLDEEN